MKSSTNTGRRRLRVSQAGKAVIGLGVSAAFVWLTLRGVDLREVQAHFKEVDTVNLYPVFIWLALIFVYKAFRWQYQFMPLKRIAFNDSLSAIVIGSMVNNAIPIRGGDLVRTHVLAKREN